MNNDFDLDALAPEPKNVKINGQIYKCNPPTIGQLVKMQKAWEEVASNPTSENQKKIIDEVLYELIPELKDHPEIGLTYKQLDALIAFVQGLAVDKKEISEATSQVTPEKKTEQVEPSPSS